MKRRDAIKLIAMVVAGQAIPEGVRAKINKIAYQDTEACRSDDVKDYIYKMKYYYRHHEGDVFLEKNKLDILKTTVARLQRLQSTIGHGNFCLIGFDDAIRYSNRYSKIGSFLKSELDFIEMIFYEDCLPYGFFGEKPIKNLTNKVNRSKVVKVHKAGNFLYKGSALETFQKIQKDVGRQVILTSGIRNVVKQSLLFLNKVNNNKGNLSLASRSLAPPGYSFHSVGDFDVGKVGLGRSNFSRRFMNTDVYKKLKDLGYFTIRYPQGNNVGVRFEPWHIKV